MAKKSSNAKTGAAIVFASVPVTYEGTVTGVTALGVDILTRPFGRQIQVERFFPMKDVISFSDEGAGFVTVLENRMVSSYYGDVTIGETEVTVSIEGGRSISFPNGSGNLQVHYDQNDEPSSPEAKLGKRNSEKLLTAIGRQEEKSSGGSKKAKTKKKK